ncbi:hypothetical protein EDD75_1370 [Thermodesulfitimonas autotrophica]|uniref:Uncharacterized protein n=1 Tax=Thermodesulfitimonas autotrophica TaxID=1894989 RepID=A0A3N5BBT0_9THEO|nr:hypothetical protein [Thermodesulfitimonas autotrophica]RPF47098.1 hypothetical protein EDD75_1370 [Thermodesulfitimonas autotrophica]
MSAVARLVEVKLYISRSSERFFEVLVLPDGHLVSLPPFGLTNVLLQEAATHPPQEAVKQALARFTDKMEMPAGNDVIFALWRLVKEGKINRPEALLSTTFRQPGEAYAAEIQFLSRALEWWLLPAGRGKRTRPAERFVASLANAGTPHFAAVVCSRSREAPSWFMGAVVEHAVKRSSDTTGRELIERTFPARVYTSNGGILPLCWAEVLYAAENNIFARPCEVCGRWFPLPKTQVGQQKFCSPSCRSASKRKRTAEKRKALKP